MTAAEPRRPTTYETAAGARRGDRAPARLGRGGLRETLDLVREGRALIEFCANELDAVGGDLEELRLDELVARLEAAAARRRRRVSTFEPAVSQLRLEVEGYALERLDSRAASRASCASTR